ncbi:hypothetical protein LQW54_012213 [Pestalotiopsis sp. IQ-011]
MDPSFTNTDHRQIDYIQTLLWRAPTLNSSQIVERVRSRFGVYPSKSVTRWLHTRMAGAVARADDDVVWGLGTRARQNSRTAVEGAGTATAAVTQTPQLTTSPLREKVRGTPWDRKVLYADRV